MSPDEALEKMRAIGTYTDIEEGHLEADAILIELLVSLGHRDLCEEWNRIEKWYA